MDGRPEIYVIDDDRDVRDSISTMLGFCGYSVRSYGSSEDFLRDAGARASGCLLIDVDLPGISGLELLRRLRDQGATIPAIIMTGGAADAARTAAAQMGAPFLEKPFSSDRLLHGIAEAVRGVQS